jgi:16S rRNA (cytosine1402-N4)-methyltransferase
LTTGHLYSFDQDEDAMKQAAFVSHRGVDGEPIQESKNKHADVPPNFTFVRSNFRYMKNFLRYYGVEQVDGVLADLGVSSHHFDESERGFSFRFDGPLDMRMNQRARLTAEEVVNTYDERALADVLYLYGELKQSRRVAAAIVKARTRKRLTTTGELIEAVGTTVQKKEWAQLFQSLRIEVNGEMEALRELLRQSVEMLKPGGRLVVITYHSLEDRMVKNWMKTGNVEGEEDKDFFGRVSSPLRLVNNKVVRPTAEEEERNPRSRSAKLRVAEKRPAPSTEEVSGL